MQDVVMVASARGVARGLTCPRRCSSAGVAREQLHEFFTSSAQSRPGLPRREQGVCGMPLERRAAHSSAAPVAIANVWEVRS